MTVLSSLLEERGVLTVGVGTRIRSAGVGDTQKNGQEIL